MRKWDTKAMRTLLLVGLATAAGSIAAAPAGAQQPVAAGAAGDAYHAPPAPGQGYRQSWGHRVDGRWWAGYQAPGGWAGYRRPVAGFVLPGFWMQPGYYIADHGYFGLPAPGPGYGWSRYYDDAVLTDRYGTVHDARIAYDWDRYGGYDDGPARDVDGYRADGGRDDRRTDGGSALAGAAVGGVAGGLLGSAIAGPGDRTAGAILGAGVGAIAGAAIADSAGRDRGAPSHADPGYGYGYGYDRDYGYGPRRTAAQDRKLAREEARHRARLDRMARKAGYRNYGDYLRARERHAHAPAYPAPTPLHWVVQGGAARGHAGGPRIEYQTLPGYVANGYYYPGATVTTVTVEPSVVTTTSTSYVTGAAGAVARPAPRPRW